MKKKLILLILLFFATGCTATYDIEIYNDDVKEDMSFIESDISKWDSEAQYGFTYRDLLVESTNYPYPAFDNAVIDEDDRIKVDGVEYYDNNLISDNNKLGQQLSYHKFSLGNFEKSSLVKKCYKYFRIDNKDGNVVISTSTENKCFDEYPNLDSITVNLKTNHKVVSSNADIVSGYHYTWNLDRENKDDAAILITLKSNEFVFNYENEFFKKIIYMVAIIGIILSIGSIIYFFFKNKRNRVNDI